MFCLLLPLWIPKSIVVVNPKAWIVWGVWVGMSPLRNPPVEEEVPPCHFSLLILEIKLNLCSDGRLEPKFAQIFVNVLVIWIFCSISAEMVWTKSNSRWRASISWELKMRRRPSSTIRFLGAERKILGTQILARKTNVQIVRAIKDFFFQIWHNQGFFVQIVGKFRIFMEILDTKCLSIQIVILTISGGDGLWPDRGGDRGHRHWRQISRPANWSAWEAFSSLWREYFRKDKKKDWIQDP